jgi:hypothetical protein
MIRRGNGERHLDDAREAIWAALRRIGGHDRNKSRACEQRRN